MLTSVSSVDSAITKFRPASYVPVPLSLLPKSTCADVVLVLEVCSECAKHCMSLRHDERKYSSVGDRVLTECIQAVLAMARANKRKWGHSQRVYGFKVKASASRLGALELTAAVRVKPSEDSELHENTLFPCKSTIGLVSTGAENSLWDHDMPETGRGSGWITHTLHSKILTRR